MLINRDSDREDRNTEIETENMSLIHVGTHLPVERPSWPARSVAGGCAVW